MIQISRRLCGLLILVGIAEIVAAVERTKRGASVYPVFQGAGHGGSGAEQNSYSFLNDGAPFIQYLGGSGGSSLPSYGGNTGSQYSNLQTKPRSGYDGTSGSPLDSNHLNAYTQSSYSSGGGGSSGWQPSSSTGSSGYGSGSYYTSSFGHLTPNFAQGSGSGAARPQRHSLPQLDANVLLHAAQISSNSQNSVLDAFNAGNPRPQAYKGGY